jgi:hypothetical protein
VVGLELCSGQSNYYGGCYVLRENGSPLYSETWEEFYGTNEFVDSDGNEYDLEIEWV